MRERVPTKTIVTTALFAALVYLGIQAFRIPMPAAVGTPFLHFGHIFVVLAALFLGPKLGTAAGLLGLLTFDVLNGFFHAMPNVFVCTLVECLAAGGAFVVLKKSAGGNGRLEHLAAVACAAIYAVLNIVLDFAWNVVQLVILGSTWGAAITAEVTAIPATVINSVFTVIGIAVLYPPVKRVFRRARIET